MTHPTRLATVIFAARATGGEEIAETLAARQGALLVRIDDRTPLAGQVRALPALTAGSDHVVVLSRPAGRAMTTAIITTIGHHAGRQASVVYVRDTPAGSAPARRGGRSTDTDQRRRWADVLDESAQTARRLRATGRIARIRTVTGQRPGAPAAQASTGT